MKVLAINGSPRVNGNTNELIKAVFKPLQTEGIETEVVQIGMKNIKGCVACYKCFENKDKRCLMSNDIVNDLMAKVFDADGIILASPTYFTDITAELKAFIDRIGLVSIANGGLLRHKVGAAVIALRRGGSIHAFDTINHLFQISQMFIVGSTYWNFGVGREKGEVLNDNEGLTNMDNLGQSMAFLLKKLQS